MVSLNYIVCFHEFKVQNKSSVLRNNCEGYFVMDIPRIRVLVVLLIMVDFGNMVKPLLL